MSKEVRIKQRQEPLFLKGLEQEYAFERVDPVVQIPEGTKVSKDWLEAWVRNVVTQSGLGLILAACHLKGSDGNYYRIALEPRIIETSKKSVLE